jgi:hypothetical protein
MPTINGFTVILADRVRETTQTTGTSTYQLDGAPSGKRTFVAGIGSGNRTVYTIESGSSWEVGIGTVTSGAPATLSRDSIIASSNSNNAVSWGAGVKDIFCSVPATLFSQVHATPFASVKPTVRTTTGTFTRDAKCIGARVRIVAGGGSGGGARITVAGEGSEAGGGGGGESAEGYFTAAQIGSSQTVTIGAGGTAAAGDGVAGGTTSFGALLTAIGGSGGAQGVGGSGNVTSAGGDGGSGGTGGYLHIPGSAGGTGRVVGGSVTFNNHGGAAGMAMGGAARPIVSTAVTGLLYGGGSPGNLHGANVGVESSGAGAAGVCIVEEYLSP